MTNFFILQTAFIADSIVQNKNTIVSALPINQTKFWLIDKLWHVITNLGVKPAFADLITFMVATVVIGALVWFVDAVIIKKTLLIIKKKAEKTESTLDDALFEHKFFSRLLEIIPLIVLLALTRMLFAGFNETIILYVRLITLCVIVFDLLLVVYSLLNVWNERFNLKQRAEQKSIKGYLQVAKIVLGFIAGICIVSILLQKDPSNLFVGLGATAALLSLVFKDTILGFVASIQLSAQDMVRPGDWIQMPSKNADGTVLDINVNSVKVQNWDNTVTMIPIYSMVSESFTNWRGMAASPGRRFVKQFQINIDSIQFSSTQLIENLQNNTIINPTFNQTLTLAKRSSGNELLTNLALFRAHLEIHLREHPKINDELPLYVRYINDTTDKGVGIEIYAFSHDKEAQFFDAVQRSVVEYTIASAQLFNLKFFQNIYTQK